MKPFLFFCLALLSVVSLSGFVVKKPAADPSGEKIVRFFFEHGRRLSPSYASADCSTLLTKAMEHFFELSVSDRRQINISFTSDLEKKDFWHYFKHKSKCMIGINYNCQHEEMFFTSINEKRYPRDQTCLCPPDNVAYIKDQEKRLSGIAGFIESRGGQKIGSITDAQKGDFIQFWYPNSWGHCGVVESVDTLKKTMTLHSSFPSTDGYGIQTFDYNDETIIYLARHNGLTRLTKTQKTL